MSKKKKLTCEQCEQEFTPVEGEEVVMRRGYTFCSDDCQDQWQEEYEQ